MKKCLRCNTTIEQSPKANNQKYCSNICRNTSYAERNKERINTQQRERWQKRTIGPKIQCAICKEEHRQVGTHIIQRHNITARQYREKYGFDVKRGQLPMDLRKRKARHVLRNNTIENLKAGKKFHFKKGQEGLGKYKRSNQTMKRLKQPSFIKKDK